MCRCSSPVGGGLGVRSDPFGRRTLILKNQRQRWNGRPWLFCFFALSFARSARVDRVAVAVGSACALGLMRLVGFSALTGVLVSPGLALAVVRCVGRGSPRAY